ncbi:MAG: glycosyltransferase family 2 protein [Candidatus Cloacimonetes bacterium]|nr:glycosyltransferase family 2 protein [Candidatus Cloacimonadota bacterium]
MTAQPELSVVVLLYRTGDLARDIVRILHDELERSGINFELVLVGNYLAGHPDSTPVILREIAAKAKDCLVVTEEKQGMMGWDMRKGMAAARGSHIAIIDGDGQMPMSDVPKVYRYLKTGGYDIVKTKRIERHDGLYRKIISLLYNWLFRILFDPRGQISDINSKPKIMTRKTYEALALDSSDWFIDAEIMIKALVMKMKIGEIPTVFHKNSNRGSFVPFWAIFEFLINLNRYHKKMKKEKCHEK